jgi:hypothetical protein
MLNCVDAVAIAMLSSSAWWSGLVWAVGAQMKNVENIQIQGEKQRAIYLEKNEKWFFRSLPFRYSNGQNTLRTTSHYKARYRRRYRTTFYLL